MLSVIINIVILAAAVVVVAKAPGWLTSHPNIARRANQIRFLAFTALFAGPFTVLVRNTRWARTHWSAVRVCPDQFPELYAILEHQCAVLGMTPVPFLYISREEKEIARAYSAWHTRYIVLNSSFLQPTIGPIRDALSFHIGRELGRIRLAHTEWWAEMLLSYIVKIPFLHNPLSRVRALSADRYGAYLAPDGVRGLILIATGRLILPSVNVDACVREIEASEPWSERLASFQQALPPLGVRIRTLYELGLFRSPGGATAGRLSTSGGSDAPKWR